MIVDLFGLGTDGLELAGRRVLLVGTPSAARHAIARCRAAGAEVTLVCAEAAGDSAHTVAPPTTRDGWTDLLQTADLVMIERTSSDRMLGAACVEQRVLVARYAAAPVRSTGHVTLVGGGPGDPSLMTVGAIEALRSADVVLFDRLGPSDLVSILAPGAELIDVGKTPGHHAVPQSRIQEMLVEHARSGRSVVRLKGGDPFVFGRGSEEVAACREAGIAITVISGVTSAIAVPGAAGIPVTHREVSRMFTVVSGHAPLSDSELSHLVGLDSTIVVLMGVGTLPHLAAGLRRHGMRADMPMAIVERGFGTNQRTTISTVSEIVPVSARVGIRSPAVMVIGEVVRLAASDDDAAAELMHSAATMVAEE